MIDESAAESAVDYLRDSAKAAGEAREQETLLEHMLKVEKARLKKLSQAKTDGQREDEALSSPEYIALVQGYAAAVGLAATYRNLRDAATAKLDMYRTQQANIRGMSR